MNGTVASRPGFLLAVAIVAAALADPVVESVANTGILGGHYADHNHLSVVPALVVGVSIALLVLLARCVDVWRSAASGDWLIDAARAFSARPPLRDLPSVFVLQLVALFLMECLEQLAQGGTLLGGTAWLGGPIAFSLLAHALIGAGCLLVLGSFMRAVLRTFASLIRVMIQCVWLAIARKIGGLRFGIREPACLRLQPTYVHEIGGRAPPLLQTPA